MLTWDFTHLNMQIHTSQHASLTPIASRVKTVQIVEFVMTLEVCALQQMHVSHSLSFI